MTYELIIETLNTKKMTMATMIKLQRVVGKKLGVFNMSEEKLNKMDEGESMEYQMQMLEVIVNLVYIVMGSPADSSPDDIGELIPFDKVEEISNAVGKFMGQVAETKKN